MRNCLFLLCMMLMQGSMVYAAPPAWLQEQVGEVARLYTPGVYSLAQDKVLAVGIARIPHSLREDRALRFAATRAENDAKQRLAHQLFPNELQGQRRYTVELSGAQVAYTEQRDGSLLLGLLVNPANVRLVSLPSLPPLADCSGVRIAPLAEALLEKSPPLAQGGGAIFPQVDTPGGWVAIGVGFAALPQTTDAKLEDQARTLAAVDARRALTEAIYGVAVNTSETSTEIVTQGPEGDLLRQWERTSTKENVRGLLQGAEVAGQWKTDDNHLGVVVLVGRPAIQLEAETAVSPDSLPQFAMEDVWQEAFLQRPWLLTGGAALHVLDDKPYVLIVEKGRLQGNPVADRTQLPILMETKARNAAARYLAGVDVQSQIVDTEERHLHSAQAKESLTNALHKLVQENVLGVVQALRKVGSWQSADGKELYVGYVVPLPQ